MHIFQAAVAAVDPARLVASYLQRHPLSGSLPVIAVGAGKPAARMAHAVEVALADRASEGLVIVPDRYEVPLRFIAVRTAGHPLPDQRGVTATAALLTALSRAPGPAVCLIGGGASSLMVHPAPPVTLADTIELTRLLLASGADIAEVNTVRKHLSLVKGGGLLRATKRRPLLTLAISDVVSDDPAVIGSGPTVPDPTTFSDALAVLRAHGIAHQVPSRIRDHLENGAKGRIPETVKPGDPEAADSELAIIGSNRIALAAAADAARQLGYAVAVTPEPLSGDTRDTARRWWTSFGQGAEGKRRCVLAGGETTVTVRGRGRGGRNQEFALALVALLDDRGAAVLSAGSDGIDGPTDAAGAFVDGQSAARARALGLDAETALLHNDSYGFFAPLGDLFRCGPTGTNVMDIKIAVGVPFGC